MKTTAAPSRSTAPSEATPSATPSRESDADLHLPWWMWAVPCIWAGAFLTGAAALERLPAEIVSFLRFAVTSAGGVIVFRRPLLAVLAARPSLKAWLAMGFLALTGGVLYHYAFYRGLAMSPPPVASVVIATNPILTTIGAALFLKTRRPTAGIFVGLALAFAGAVALAADKPLPEGQHASTFVGHIRAGWGMGETLCFVASLAWAVFAVSMQHFRSTVLSGLPSAGVTFFVYFITAIAFLPFCVANGSLGSIATMNATEWGCMLYLGLIATVIAYTMYNAAIDRVGSARVSQVTYAVPTLTTVLSIALGRFHPGWLTGVGLVLVTLGLIVADGRVVQSLRSRRAS